MKNIFITIFSILISCNALSAIKTSFHSNGKIMSETNYERSLKEGEEKWWYENGQLKHKANYISDKLNGKWESWHDNGEKFEQGNYINDKANGVWTYIGENGNKYKEARYKNGIADGVWTKWNRYVKKSSIENYQNGNLINTIIYKYYEHGKGQIESIQNFKNGLLNGKSTTWYENGQKFTEGFYKNDNAHGKWIFWKKNGQIHEERNYKDGELVAETVYKYSLFSGRLKSAKKYVNNICVSGC